MNKYIEDSKKFNKLADECIENGMEAELELAFNDFVTIHKKAPLHSFEIK